MRFIFPTWHLYLLCVILFCHKSICSTSEEETVYEGQALLDTSFERLTKIDFGTIKSDRLLERGIDRLFDKEKYIQRSALSKALKGIHVKINDNDKEWVKKHIGFYRKGSKNKGYMYAYYLLRKLRYNDTEAHFSISKKEDWPPQVLITLDQAIADAFRTPIFHTLVDEFNMQDTFQEAMGTYYYNCYQEGASQEEDITIGQDHYRDETEQSFQDLLDNAEKLRTCVDNPSGNFCNEVKEEIPPYTPSEDTRNTNFVVILIGVPSVAVCTYYLSKRKNAAVIKSDSTS